MPPPTCERNVRLAVSSIVKINSVVKQANPGPSVDVGGLERTPWREQRPATSDDAEEDTGPGPAARGTAAKRDNGRK